MLTSFLLLRAQYCFHPSSRISSKRLEHKKCIIQRWPEEKNFLVTSPASYCVSGEERDRRTRCSLINAFLKRYPSLVRIFCFICYTSSFRKIKVGILCTRPSICEQIPSARSSFSSVHSMAESHTGEIMSKDVTKHRSTKTITKGSQGLLTLIFNCLTTDCPQSFQIC